MRADLDTLLRDAGGDPASSPDVDAMWAGGRRRRTLRRLSAASGGLAGVAALVLVASSVLSGVSGTAVPEIEPMAPPVDTSHDDAATDATDDGTDAVPSVRNEDADAAEAQRQADSAEQQRPRADAEPVEEPATDPVEPPAEAPTPTSNEPAAPAPAAPSAPTPDSARLADPCAVHTGGEMRAFIDLVSPVAGQQVGGSIDLVGCSSVYEGTVRYRVVQGSTVLVDSFTTATAGGPEIGEFRETITLNATGPLTLEVFWDSPAGEGERNLSRVSLDAG
jgi:hypothetical protein